MILITQRVLINIKPFALELISALSLTIYLLIDIVLVFLGHLTKVRYVLLRAVHVTVTHT